MFVLSVVIFVLGYKFYKIVPAEGSIYIKAYRTFKLAFAEKKAAKQSGELLKIDKDVSFKFLEYRR